MLWNDDDDGDDGGDDDDDDGDVSAVGLMLCLPTIFMLFFVFCPSNFYL